MGPPQLAALLALRLNSVLATKDDNQQQHQDVDDDADDENIAVFASRRRRRREERSVVIHLDLAETVLLGNAWDELDRALFDLLYLGCLATTTSSTSSSEEATTGGGSPASSSDTTSSSSSSSSGDGSFGAAAAAAGGTGGRLWWWNPSRTSFVVEVAGGLASLEKLPSLSWLPRRDLRPGAHSFVADKWGLEKGFGSLAFHMNRADGTEVRGAVIFVCLIFNYVFFFVKLCFNFEFAYFSFTILSSSFF
jgi:hypothetical protein